MITMNLITIDEGHAVMVLSMLSPQVNKRITGYILFVYLKKSTKLLSPQANI